MNAWQGKVVFGIDAVLPTSALLEIAALTEVEQIDASIELVESASGVGVGKGPLTDLARLHSGSRVPPAPIIEVRRSTKFDDD